MIRFEIFNKGKQVKELSISQKGMYLFGQDEIPIRSQLEMSDGQLLGIRHNDSNVGLVTLWPVDKFGQVVLQTTRLPDRDKPYNLNVELARGRLLRINQKREDWGMSVNGHSLSKKQHELIDRSLDKLVDALSYIDDPPRASLAADESLYWAMQAGEMMSRVHADLFLKRRLETQGFSRHSFGCCMDINRIHDSKYLEYIKNTFRFVTIPIGWKQVEPKEQERNFDILDECVNWLHHHHIAVKVGPLLSFSLGALPDWLFIWENDFDQVRDMAYDYITEVVERYGRKVQAWDVCNGLNANNCFKFSFEQIIEITRSSALAAKRAAPRSLILVGITEPWGEYYAYNQITLPPMIYLDMICQSGVNFDGLGLTLRFGRGGAGMRVRDLLDISSLMDKIGIFGKPIHLSCVQVPSQPDVRDASNPRMGEAGSWHGSWNEKNQADWIQQLYRIALSKPFIETITWADLADRNDGILTHGGLFTADMVPKQAYKALCNLKKELVGNDRTKQK